MREQEQDVWSDHKKDLWAVFLNMYPIITREILVNSLKKDLNMQDLFVSFLLQEDFLETLGKGREFWEPYRKLSHEDQFKTATTVFREANYGELYDILNV